MTGTFIVLAAWNGLSGSSSSSSRPSSVRSATATSAPLFGDDRHHTLAKRRIRTDARCGERHRERGNLRVMRGSYVRQRVSFNDARGMISRVTVHRRGRGPRGPGRGARARGARRHRHGHRGARSRRRPGVDAARRVRRPAARRSGRRPHRGGAGARPLTWRASSALKPIVFCATASASTAPTRAAADEFTRDGARFPGGRRDSSKTRSRTSSSPRNAGTARWPLVSPDSRLPAGWTQARRPRNFVPACARFAASFWRIPRSCRCCRSSNSSPRAARRGSVTPSESRRATTAWRRFWPNASEDGFSFAPSCGACSSAMRLFA